MNDITSIPAVVIAPAHATSLIFRASKILYVAMQINRYGSSVVTTEMLASSSKRFENKISIELKMAVSIVAETGVPCVLRFLNNGTFNSPDRFCITLEVPSMYAFNADSIAMIPITAISFSDSANTSPEAVATGAGDRARAALPTLPIREMFNKAYTEITITITNISDLNMISFPLVSSAGMAHISNPVKVQ